MNNLNIIPIWLVGIAYFLALGGIIAYVATITGNRLDASEQEIEDMKAGIRRRGLRHYFSDGILYTLFLILAKLLNQFAVQPVNVKIYYLMMATVLGIANLYVSIHRMEILALDAEVPLIPRYKIAFALLGIINLVAAIAGYLAK